MLRSAARRVTLCTAASSLVALGFCVPAGAVTTTQQQTCTSGRTWTVKATWGSRYTDAAGVARTTLDVAWRSSGTVTTDWRVRAVSGDGTVAQDTRRTEKVAYGTTTWRRYDARNPAGTTPSVRVTLGVDADGVAGCTVSFKAPTADPTRSPAPPTSPTAGTITSLPGQPALTAYGSSSAAASFAKPGALVITGRDQYNQAPFKAVAAAGGTVLLYIDPIIDASYGRYHDMLVHKSVCGPATSRWPGSPRANEWGYLQDFRVRSAVQSKLKCVLEAAVAENPHLGGFFADDLGSRSWYPGFSWDSWGTTNQQAYRDGAIALARTFHDVAAEHGLMVMVNGTWGGGTLARNGGGYPNMGTNGLSLADGGYIEHHAASEVSYWTGYAKGQWGTAPGSASQGKPIMYVQASTDADRAAYQKAGVFAYLSTQREYSTATTWGRFHRTGLPTKVAR